LTPNSSRLEHASNSFAFVHRLLDLAILISAVFIAASIHNVLFDKNYLILLLAQVVLFSYIAEAVQQYRAWRLSQFSRMLWQSLMILVCSFVILLVALFLLKASETFSRVVMGLWFMLSMTAMLGWRLCWRMFRRVQAQHGIHLQKVAIVGLTPRGLALYEEINQHPTTGLTCIGFFDDREPDRFPPEYRKLLLGTVTDSVLTAQSGVISRLYISLPLHAEKRILQIVQQLGDTTLNVYLVPDFLMMNMMHGKLSSVGEIDTISVFESPHLGVQNYLKRTFDVVFSASALLLLSPLLLLIAVVVRLTSAGPVIFVQDRYGLDGKKIGVYKFRTMKVQENSGTVTQATQNDPRVTPVGRFLRRTSLDELPQFLNVLTGEMSVVGPRPHAVAHNEHYRNRVAFYMLRHKVKPGITGWAQINGWRGETDTLDKMEKRVEFDLYYIRNWSLWFDIKIVIKTVFKGFSGKHVY